MSEEETTSSGTSEGTAVEEAAAPAKAEGSGSERHLRKTRVGLVTSDKMHKTIVVEVIRRVPHPLYKKIIKQSTRLYAHDEEGKAKVGDKVKLMECRPISKKKRWRLLEVLAH